MAALFIEPQDSNLTYDIDQGGFSEDSELSTYQRGLKDLHSKRGRRVSRAWVGSPDRDRREHHLFVPRRQNFRTRGIPLLSTAFRPTASDKLFRLDGFTTLRASRQLEGGNGRPVVVGNITSEVFRVASTDCRTPRSFNNPPHWDFLHGAYLEGHDAGEPPRCTSCVGVQRLCEGVKNTNLALPRRRIQLNPSSTQADSGRMFPFLVCVGEFRPGHW